MTRTGKRRQLYRSFDRLKDAMAEYARVVSDVTERRYVARSGTTVSAYLEAWLPAHTRDLEEAGAAKVRHLLRAVLERLGDRRLQSLTRADVDGLADWMLISGRVRAGKPGTGLSAHTVKDTLAVLQRALDDAADERLVTHNPCRRVKRPRQERPEHELWSDDEAVRFEAKAARDRLAPVITCRCSACARRKPAG